MKKQIYEIAVKLAKETGDIHLFNANKSLRCLISAHIGSKPHDVIFILSFFATKQCPIAAKIAGFDYKPDVLCLKRLFHTL